MTLPMTNYKVNTFIYPTESLSEEKLQETQAESHWGAHRGGYAAQNTYSHCSGPQNSGKIVLYAQGNAVNMKTMLIINNKNKVRVPNAFKRMVRRGPNPDLNHK